MITFDKVKIGKQIENARKKAGFSQDIIADYLGIDQGLFSKYENGERPITMDNLDKLKDLFKCTLSYFIEGENENLILDNIALRGSKIDGESLKTISYMNKIIANLQEMDRLIEGK